MTASASKSPQELFNVAEELARNAAAHPYRPAIIYPAARTKNGQVLNLQINYQQLDQVTNRYARGLAAYGFQPGERTLVMMRPSIDFIALVFSLFRIGAVPVLIDPGMGLKPFLQCIRETEPVNFIGIPAAHLMRLAGGKAFQTVKKLVTAGKSGIWGGASLKDLKSPDASPFPCAPTRLEDEAAVAFTSGSTGVPKGVVYRHGMFQAQIDLLANEIGIQPGEVDLPGLYIFALFNPALGTTTIWPDMDPSAPAKLNPAYLVEGIQTHGVTYSFGSPIIWKIVGTYCKENGLSLPSMKHIIMAGAPVSPWVIELMNEIAPNAEIMTPFGCTEALPITLMTGTEILEKTAPLSNQGKGNCVGRPIRGHEIQVIRISNDPIHTWEENLIIPQGEVGEIVVRGPVVTRSYLNRPQKTAEAKILNTDGSIWHRMGDLGYFDDQGRLWFCGRKTHRIESPQGLLLPVTMEAIFNQHPLVSRTALVGVGVPGQEEPVLIVEVTPEIRRADRTALQQELLGMAAEHDHTRQVHRVLFLKHFPVDVRHNAKISRENLKIWAEKQLKRS